MSNDKKYVEGLFANRPHEKAPDFVKASLSIQVERFIEWLSEQETSEKGYVKIDILEGREGAYYAKHNDWNPDKEKREKPSEKFMTEHQGDNMAPSDDLPF